MTITQCEISRHLRYLHVRHITTQHNTTQLSLLVTIIESCAIYRHLLLKFIHRSIGRNFKFMNVTLGPKVVRYDPTWDKVPLAESNHWNMIAQSPGVVPFGAILGSKSDIPARIAGVSE